MKYLLVASFLISTTALAYHTSTLGTHPVKEPSVEIEKRHPASVEVKAVRQEEAVKVQEKK